MFENDEIDVNELPRAENVSWQALDSTFVRRLHVTAVITIFFLIVGVGMLNLILSAALADVRPSLSFAWLWIIPPPIALALFAWPLISVPRKGFAVRDKDIVYKSGVFWHTVTAIPFNRIQHVEKSSTLLDRRYGIATLQLFTAGGSGGDLKIHGLSEDIAENIRTFILDKAGSIVEHD